jgi:leucyl/phenylalanyl-tRNA---protein transferase
MSLEFPDPHYSTPEGIVALGGNLEVETLLSAYRKGIFPWPQEGFPLLWFCPDPRGVIDFSDFHVPESLRRFAKKNQHWRFTFNQAFPEVIKNCRLQKRPGQKGTWITAEVQKAYVNFFNAGHVISLECWDEDELIGGIYGVDQNGLFSGESMFFKKNNASKMCLWRLLEHLRRQGRTWIDIQMVTPVTEMFGGKYIPRDEFLSRIGV